MRDVVMFDFRCYPFIQGAKGLQGSNRRAYEDCVAGGLGRVL